MNNLRILGQSPDLESGAQCRGPSPANAWLSDHVQVILLPQASLPSSVKPGSDTYPDCQGGMLERWQILIMTIREHLSCVS